MLMEEKDEPLRYGAPVSLALAIKVAEAAATEAEAQGWPMVIAVVDSGGHLVVLHRMDQAQHGSMAACWLRSRRPGQRWISGAPPACSKARWLKAECTSACWE